MCLYIFFLKILISLECNMSNLFSLLKISPAISDSTNTIFVAISLVNKFTILILVLKGPRYFI